MESLGPIDLITRRMEAARREAERLSGLIAYDGKLQPALTSETFEVENPADGTIIGSAPRCRACDVDKVVQSAHRAFGEWSRVPARERGALLLKVAERLEAEREAIAQLSSLETGNALATQTRGEATTMVDIFRFFAGLAGELKGKTVPWRDGVFLYTKREPMGVVAAIIPWNAPLMQMATKTAAALAAGNTVVLKTAEQAPLAVLKSFEILQTILPQGVANVISGFGEEAGQPLAEHPLVRKVTFTGSSAVGARILHAVADKIVPVTAELGGKNPNIVMPDADIELAAKGVIQGLRLQRQGQSCTAGTRIYLHDDVYEPVLERVLAAIPTFKMGNPLDETTQVGSLISREQLDRVERYVAMARQTNGVRILIGGERPADPTLRRGYFYTTTLIEGLPPSSPVCRDEIFGPVATIRRWRDFDSVLAEANDTNFGLAAVIWTESLRNSFEFIDKINAGFVQVNQFSVAEANIEFGGTKLSGIGRELSAESLVNHFTWSKTVIINTSAQ